MESPGRRYTVTEIEALRRTIGERIGPPHFEILSSCFYSPSAQNYVDAGNTRRSQAHSALIEDQVRTAILAGITAEDIQRENDEREDRWRTVFAEGRGYKRFGNEGVVKQHNYNQRGGVLCENADGYPTYYSSLRELAQHAEPADAEPIIALATAAKAKRQADEDRRKAAAPPPAGDTLAEFGAVCRTPDQRFVRAAPIAASWAPDRKPPDRPGIGRPGLHGPWWKFWR